MRRLFWPVAALIGLGAVIWAAQPGQKPGQNPGPQVATGLFTSLPILWNEAPDVAGQLNDAAPPHWARAELAARGPITALDTLASGGSAAGPLAGLTRLVLAQPRPLSPDENVALDNWVKGGGRLLLLADPALTQHSDFPITDPRRPQAVVLLSPILSRWGLDLTFDEAQPYGERVQPVMDVPVPYNLAGRWRVSGQASGGVNCRAWGDGLAVTCAVGKGRVVALADAAVLEPDDPDGARSKALRWLLDAAFIGN
ncbi:DUF4350 domain-containing protein [Novosphingobium sp.]|uniref:DUF4350 domain-containing protein n=1 Tax=Novosphingobium sp. TaxID=1874826 RepID=UPI0027369BFE|nr:DUF4350 domain-containing protein [Novosphingobium sp.]MDP3905780.1 ABC transporter [Novosphingobium sp.]